ncbi:galactokinase-like [Planococcus citri]|uniref:galactokinase-like n=1 Tax=Planococcus citri TaxID=170843 RepID=UPI0031F96CEE
MPSLSHLTEIVPVDELLAKAVTAFRQHFDCNPEVAGIAPGRVNLIGEHTDYNEGFVFPMALPMVTIVVGKKTGSNKCTIITANENVGSNKTVEFPVPNETNPLECGEPKWANYVKGVVQCFKGPRVGFQAAIISSVPVGGGLSSSAALEVAVYSFLEGLTSTKTDTKEKALLCQKAEHIFASTPCGIMDQFVSIHGEQDSAVLIDCRSQDVTNVPIPKSDIKFLIINSNVHHNLATSEYSVRRQTCEDVAKKMQKKSLREATLTDLEKLNSTGVLTEKMYKRALHVIKENDRVIQATKALQNNSLDEFGLLMNESHESLSKDYEVSCTELDQLVDIVGKIDGVYGTRMTGGGFGGCTVTLLKSSAVDEVIKSVQQNYQKKASFYVVTASQGARIKYLNF